MAIHLSTPSMDGVAIHGQTHFDHPIRGWGHPIHGQLLFPYRVTPTMDSILLIDGVTPAVDSQVLMDGVTLLVNSLSCIRSIFVTI
jgi:hypothetical protein